MYEVTWKVKEIDEGKIRQLQPSYVAQQPYMTAEKKEGHFS
jgi:hypothetical protein